MKTANHYLTDTTTKTNFPAATILPHNLSRVWLWKPGYWFRWQQHQTVCSSHVLTQLRCELMLHSWKINWRLLSSGFQSEQLKWAQNFTHRGVGSSPYGQTVSGVSSLFQTVIGLVPFIISMNMTSIQKHMLTLNPWLFVKASIKILLINLFLLCSCCAGQLSSRMQRNNQIHSLASNLLQLMCFCIFARDK